MAFKKETTKTITLILKVTKEISDKLQEMSELENRSRANWIETTILRAWELHKKNEEKE